MQNFSVPKGKLRHVANFLSLGIHHSWYSEFLKGKLRHVAKFRFLRIQHLWYSEFPKGNLRLSTIPGKDTFSGLIGKLRHEAKLFSLRIHHSWYKTFQCRRGNWDAWQKCFLPESTILDIQIFSGAEGEIETRGENPSSQSESNPPTLSPYRRGKWDTKASLLSPNFLPTSKSINLDKFVV